MTNTIDLQTHSWYSDGVLSPLNLVKYAASKGILVLALTDHDTVAGLPEVIRYGREYNIGIVPGIELTAGEDGREYHFLGYHVDWQAQSFVEEVQLFWNQRRDRNLRILANLSSAGFPITIHEVEKTVGFKWHDRKDIARTLVSLGYIASFRDAFTESLIGSDSPLYVPPPALPPRHAIRVILDGKGVPVLAHPGTRPGGRKDAYPIPREKIAQFSEWGLRGLEVYYSRHSQDAVLLYKRIADELGLIPTGGSDFHRIDPLQPDVGETEVPAHTVELLRSMALKLRDKEVANR